MIEIINFTFFLQTHIYIAMVSVRSQRWSEVKRLAKKHAVPTQVRWTSTNADIIERLTELRQLDMTAEQKLYNKLEQWAVALEEKLPANITPESNIDTLEALETKWKPMIKFNRQHGGKTWLITARVDIKVDSYKQPIRNQTIVYRARQPDKELNNESELDRDMWAGFDEANIGSRLFHVDRFIEIIDSVPLQYTSPSEHKMLPIFNVKLHRPHLGAPTNIINRMTCVYDALESDHKLERVTVSDFIGKPIEDGLTVNDIIKIAKHYNLSIVVIDLEGNKLGASYDLAKASHHHHATIYMMGDGHLYQLDDEQQRLIARRLKNGGFGVDIDDGLTRKRVEKESNKDVVIEHCANFAEAIAKFTPTNRNINSEIAEIERQYAIDIQGITKKERRAKLAKKTAAIRKLRQYKKERKQKALTATKNKKVRTLMSVKDQRTRRRPKINRDQRINIHVAEENLFDDIMDWLRLDVAYQSNANFATHECTHIKLAPNIHVYANPEYKEHMAVAEQLGLADQYVNQRFLGLAKMYFKSITADRPWIQSCIPPHMKNMIRNFGGWNWRNNYVVPDDMDVHGVDLYRNYASTVLEIDPIVIDFECEPFDYDGEVDDHHMYYINAPNNRILFVQTGAYVADVVKVGLEDNLITEDQILYKIPIRQAPSNKVILSDFVHGCYRVESDEHRKKMVNFLVGEMANSLTSGSRSITRVVASKHEANYLNTTSGFTKRSITAISAEEFGLKRNLYQFKGSQRQNSMVTDRVLRNQIVQMSMLRTYQLMNEVEGHLEDAEEFGYPGGKIVAVQTDCVKYTLPKGCPIFETDDNNEFGSTRYEETTQREYVRQDRMESDGLIPDLPVINPMWHVTMASKTDNLPLDTITQHNRAFISGFAGSGKTFLANALATSITHEGGEPLCMAFTNCAANLMECGKTFHSAIRMGFDCETNDDAVRKIIMKHDTIIIDEVSMVPMKIYKILASMPPTTRMYFFGDFRQHQPIEKTKPVDGYENSQIFRSLCHMNKIVLQKSYRSSRKWADKCIDYFEKCDKQYKDGRTHTEGMDKMNAIRMPLSYTQKDIPDINIVKTNKLRRYINKMKVRQHGKALGLDPVPAHERQRVHTRVKEKGVLNTVEHINASKLAYVIQHAEQYAHVFDSTKKTPDELMYMAKKLLANSSPTDDPNIRKVNVTHRRRNNMFAGRHYADGSVSLQNMNKKIRSVCAEGMYQDIDMVNAHPTIYSFVAGQHGCDTPLVDEYVNDRERVLKMLAKQCKSDRSTMKTLVLELMNGSKLDYQIRRFGLTRCEWITKFHAEIQRATKHICKDDNKRYKLFYKQLVDEGNDPDRRHMFRFVNQKMCEWESKALTQLIKCTDFTHYVPCFDGVMIPTDVTVDMADVAKKINERYGLGMKFSSKPFDVVELPEDIPEYDCESDFHKSLAEFITVERLDEFEYVYPGMKVISEHTAKVDNVILYTKNHRDTIRYVEDGMVVMEQGLVIPMADLQLHWRPSYAITSHKAQGQTISERYVIHEFDKMDQFGRYVALTRTEMKKNVRLAELNIGSVNGTLVP